MIVNTTQHGSWRLREAVPFWFAISSPLIELIFGLLGTWFVRWITTWKRALIV
jgi:hypothetical protein